MRYFWCFVMPWIAVWMCRKSGGLICLVSLLTLCFWIPGVIVALLIVLQTEADERQERLIRSYLRQTPTELKF